MPDLDFQPHGGPLAAHLTLAEMAFGTEKTLAVPTPGDCVNCLGTGRDGGEACEFCDGTGVMVVDRETAIALPAGLCDGDLVHVACDGIAEGLTVAVREREHPHFRRVGLNLHTVMEVEPEVFDRGDVIDVETLDGEVELRVPPATAIGAVLRAAGQGMTARDVMERRGDLLVELRPLAKTAPAAVAAVKRGGRGMVLLGLGLVLAGLFAAAFAIAVRATTDVCETTGDAACSATVSGTAVGEAEATAEEQRDTANATLAFGLVPSVVAIGFGVQAMSKGFKRLGATNVTAKQRRRE